VNSPYLTPIITLLVGSPSKEFKVHSGVISESRVLASKYQALGIWHHFSLPNVDPSIFELALSYMYGKDYKDYFSPTNPIPKKSDVRAAAFRRHSLLYCFARNFELDGLVALATKRIKDLGQVDYESVFSAAKEAYKQLPEEESWFRDCFKGETKRALKDCRDLVREPWVLDAFRDESGNFTTDLFTALTEGYEKIISKAASTGSGSRSSPQLLRWFSPNLSHAAYVHTANSSSEEWTEGETASERDSVTDETSSDEIMSLKGTSCVEELAPAEEPPYIVDADPEEPAYVVEYAAIEESPYLVEAAIPEAPPCDEPERPYQEVHIAAPEEIADVDGFQASAPEVEICAADAKPANDYGWNNSRTWNSFRSMKEYKETRKNQPLFGLAEFCTEAALEPEAAVEECAPPEEILEAAEAIPAEAALAEEAAAEAEPAEDPGIDEYDAAAMPADPEPSNQAIEIMDVPADAPADCTYTVRPKIDIPYGMLNTYRCNNRPDR
jgi:hypothetical protein